MDDYFAFSSTFWHCGYYQEEGKYSSLTSSLIFLSTESKMYIIFINTVFPFRSGEQLKETAIFFIILGASEPTIYGVVSYIDLALRFLFKTLWLLAAVASTYASYKFYSLYYAYSCYPNQYVDLGYSFRLFFMHLTTSMNLFIAIIVIILQTVFLLYLNF